MLERVLTFLVFFALGVSWVTLMWRNHLWARRHQKLLQLQARAPSLPPEQHREHHHHPTSITPEPDFERIVRDRTAAREGQERYLASESERRYRWLAQQGIGLGLGITPEFTATVTETIERMDPVTGERTTTTRISNPQAVEVESTENGGLRIRMHTALDAGQNPPAPIEPLAPIAPIAPIEPVRFQREPKVKKKQPSPPDKRKTWHDRIMEDKDDD